MTDGVMRKEEPESEMGGNLPLALLSRGSLREAWGAVSPGGSSLHFRDNHLGEMGMCSEKGSRSK